jgi:hypothetical protein
MRVLEAATDRRPIQAVFHPRRELVLAVLSDGAEALSFFDAYAQLDAD